LRNKKKFNLSWIAGIGLISLLYVIIKMYALNAYVGDEHIYLYQAKLISQGMVPYKDFAMAHPPLQALFTAVIFKVCGYNFVLYRLLPILWYLAGGLVLAVMVYRELGSSASIIAVAFSLLSYEPLRASSHFTGVNMTITLLLAAYLAYRSNLIKICACFCIAAVFTRLYAIPGVAILLLWAFISDYRASFKLIAWMLGIGLILFVILGLWTGFRELITNVYQYHIYKNPMKPEEIINMKATILFHNAVPVLLFLLSLPLLVTEAAKHLKTINEKRNILRRLREITNNFNFELPILGTVVVGLYLFTLLSLDRIWMYYFVPLFSFAGIAVGWAVSYVICLIKRIVNARLESGKANLMKYEIIVTSVVVVMFVIGFYISPKLEGNLKYYQQQMQQPAEQRVHYYSWQPSVLPDFIDNIVNVLFWHDERIIGKTYCSFTYLLWHESRIFDIANDMVEEIYKRTSQNEWIFGDSGSIPLLALLSDRHIAANEIDTNIQRYVSGYSNPDKLIERIDNDLTKLIILRRNFGVAGLTAIRELIEKKYRIVNKFETAQGQVYLIYERVIENN